MSAGGRGFLKSKRAVKIVGTILVFCLIWVSVPWISGLLSSTYTISSTGTIVTPSNGSVFSTSFESGDPASEVSYVEVTPPPSYPQDEYVWGVVTGSQEQSHTGLWSAKLYSVDGGPSGRCRLNFVVEPAKRLYARAYFYVESWSGYIQVMRFWSDHPEDQQESGAGDYVARITINGGSITAQLGKQSNTFERVASRSFVTGRWYSIEMLLDIDASDGEFRVYVDDQEVTELTYIGDTYTGWCHWITEVRAGVVLYQQNVAPATIFVDDYAVDTTKIGLTS
jgi:hypothetical protein